MNLDQFDLVVVGAGISGATVAYIAAHDYHQRVLVIEKKKRVGGMLYDEKDAQTGLLVQRCGTHFVHTNDKNVYKFLTGIAEWEPFALRSGVNLSGGVVPSPFNFAAIDSLYSPDEAHELKMLLAEKFDYRPHISLMEMLKSEEKAISDFAKKLMNQHFIPFTAKQRGIAEDRLSGIVMEGNFFALSYHDQCYLDHYQMLPREGFSALIEKMLSDQRIVLKLGANIKDYFRISKDLRLIFANTEKEIPVVFTGSLDELFEYRFGKIPYYSMSVKYQIENVGQRQAPCTVYPNRDYTSVTDFSLLNQIGLSEKTVVSYEYPSGTYTSEDSLECFPTVVPSDHRRYARYRRLADQVKGLYLCGRLPKYCFMDISGAILDAMSIVNELKLGEMDLVPDYVKYKRPQAELLMNIDNFAKTADVESELIIGDLSRDLPTLTVIIPTYKRLESLKKALNSVWNQDLPKTDYDVLIVDNDPSPNNETQKYLEQLKVNNLYYYKNRENLGAYGNMNRCIRLARTKWVSMLHDDDILFPNALRWAILSREELNDPKLGAIIPRQLQAFSKEEIARRLKERGVVDEDIIKNRKRTILDKKRRWRLYFRTKEDTKRRYWKISKFDCYMVPFLYPAPSYGTLLNRDAMLEIGGFNEGYPTDDNLTLIRMSERYHCYLCGESWGVYSFYTADVTKPRSALQFVDAVVQYRLYMEQRSLLCRIAGKLLREGTYVDAVDGDVAYGRSCRGYNVKAENYQFYSEYQVNEKEKKRARRLQKCWDMWILLRAKLFGKRVSYDLIKRCNGEHF